MILGCYVGFVVKKKHANLLFVQTMADNVPREDSVLDDDDYDDLDEYVASNQIGLAYGNESLSDDNANSLRDENHEDSSPDEDLDTKFTRLLKLPASAERDQELAWLLENNGVELGGIPFGLMRGNGGNFEGRARALANLLRKRETS